MNKIFIAMLMFLISTPAFSKAITVDAIGEAEIVGTDIPTAKNIAISRAKWSALEQASGIKVKVDTIMNNAQLADEAVKSEISGVIKSFKITDEGKDGQTYWISIKAEIEPDKAKNTIGSFSKNTSIAVILPAVMADGTLLANNNFSQAVVNELIKKGFDVVDIANVADKEIKATIDKAIVTKNYELLKSVSNQLMAASLLIGTTKTVPMGRNVGYTNIDFDIVSGELDWTLIGDKDGKKNILASGSFSSRGQGATPTNAIYNLLKNMAEDITVKLVSTISQDIIGENSKSIRIALKGDPTPSKFRQLRDDVKNIPFVLDVKEQGMDTIIANYPEKTYYLASFLTRNNKYRIIKLDEFEIILERM